MSGLDWPARAALQRRRWREPQIEGRQHRLALAIAVLLHALFVVAIWYGMRSPPARPVVPAPVGEVMHVRFIAQAPATAAAPPPQALPPPPKPRPLPRAPEPPAKDAMVVRLPTPPPAPASPLYDEHGQPLLPASAASAPLPGYVQRMPQGDTGIMRHDSPVTYRATRFDNDWNSGGSAIDSALQKLVDKTTLKKTVRLPGGIRIHCAVSLAMLAGGCGGDPPAPPSAKDGDERLSMAPTRSLDGAAHAPKPPDEASCIAMYRAGKPLAWGCPVDTPNRAVDAERHERAAGASGHP
ncbi:hypothetical protein ACFPPA_16055 [Rhodanobacter ginsengisoli]|uniref:Energy transducer TonB n=1 Tax=Rhodanobacter ginsengisoli TaxID=418646 RepID=A0ABW0QR73_9GAMM